MKNDLIEEYRSLAAICAQTNYGNKASVRRHNKAVDRMYKIVDKIATEHSPETTDRFIGLLSTPEHKTNVWAAIHVLEKLSVSKESEQKALSIINSEAQGDSVNAIGYQYWLKNWYKSQIN